jgi:Bacterial Ig-like domain
MHDVAMRRMLAALVIAVAVALLVVSGAMLFGLGKPAQAQSDPEPPCDFDFCLDKTATPNPATVGEPITFTINERCVTQSTAGCESTQNIVDELPSGLSIVSVEDSDPNIQCTTSENTVTCPGDRSTTPTSPFTLTIVATPTECGSFTNTVSKLVNTARVTFTVEGCLPTDTEAPKVTSTFPRNGGEVGPAASIRATFSEDMREASVMNAFKLFKKGSTNQIAAQVTYDAATDTATLNPTNNLRRGANYKAVVTTVAKDEAGNRLDQNSSKAGLQQKVWFFEIDN